jgi:RNA polymerase sigma-70 factor (ECF subfamily)
MTGNREDAEEIAQDAFVKGYRSLGSFRRDAKFSSWLYRIVFNAAVARIRRRRPASVSLDDAAFAAEPGMEAEGPAQLMQKERRACIAKAMSALDPSEAAVVTLFYLEEQGVAEISESTGLSASNVKVKLHRSRKKLQEILGRMLEGELEGLAYGPSK